MTTLFFSKEQLDFIQSEIGNDLTFTPLQEEASTRRYFLVKSNHLNLQKVICIDSKVNLDFIEISKYLLSNGIFVPKVHSYEQSLGITIMSFEGFLDFSTYDLKTYVENLPKVLDLILKLQSLSPPKLVLDRRFDTEKLSFEVNLTIEKFDLLKTKYNLKSEISVETKAFLDETIGYLDQYPVQVFTHRDFHCRNLLIHPKNFYCLIDFQDARMGVPQYDLSSILYDAYYPLPREVRNNMLLYFKTRNKDQSKKFTEAFYLQALQRSFKALGTYFRMVVDQNNSKFKPSILSCLNQLEEIIQLGLFSDSLYIFIRSLRDELSSHPDFKSV